MSSNITQGTQNYVNDFETTLNDQQNQSASLIDNVNYDLHSLTLRGLEAGPGILINVVDADNDQYTTDETKIVISSTGGSGGGEVNTASNLGTGAGLFAQKIGTDLQFKSIVAGSGIDVSVSGTALTITSTINPSMPLSMLDLNDTPASYASSADYVLTVNSSETGIEFTQLPASALSGDYADLTNTPFIPTTFADLSGQIDELMFSSALQSKVSNVRKVNAATVDPAASNDTTEGYEINSQWVNTSTNEVFVAVDVSAGAAVWEQTTINDELGTVAFTNDYDDLDNLPNLSTIATTGDYNDLINSPDQFSDFLSLDDTPSGYTGLNGYIVTVNPAANGLTFVDPEMIDLGSNAITDAANIGSGSSNGLFYQKSGSILQFRGLLGSSNISITEVGNDLVIDTSGAIGATELTGLTDTPSSYSGEAGQYLRVNAGETGISFETIDYSHLSNRPDTLNQAGGNISGVISIENGTYTLTVDSLNQMLDDMTDVDTSGAVAGSVLKYDGSDWIVGVDDGVSNLNDLDDVDVSGILHGQILAWDSSLSTWLPANNSGSGGTVGSLNDLSDVDVGTPGTGDVLSYDGSEWTSVSLGAGGLQNVFTTVSANTGSTTADSPTDTLNVVGGAGVETAITGDTLTINLTAGAGIERVEDDSSPVLGGDLDTNNYEITNNIGDITIGGVHHSKTETDTIANNTTDVIISRALTQIDGMFIDYVIARPGDGYKAGRLYVTHDGTTVSVADTGVDQGNTGVEFSGAVNGANIEISYTSTDTSNAGQITFTYRYWADGYTPTPGSFVGGSSGASSVYITQVEDDTAPVLGGTLDTNGYEITNTSGDITLGGVEYSKLATQSISDNTSAVFMTVSDTVNAVFLDYTLSRTGDGYRTGTLMIVHNGTTASVTDSGTDVNDVGVEFSAALVGGNIEVSYTSTASGNAGSMQYTYKYW